MELKALSLFSGIGGLDLAAEMAGIETVALCEIEPFFQSNHRNRKNNKGGGNPMKIGDKGYLIEVGMKGVREDKWLKPPLYELIEIQKGFNVTHYVFRSVEGGYKRTMMDKDFISGEWAFTDNPEPISRSEQPRLKARIADISKHSYITKFNKGGFVS